MKIIQKENNDIILIAVKGRMKIEDLLEFEKKMNATTREGRTLLLMDLSALEYLSATDLRMILPAIKEINRKRGKAVSCCLKEWVKEVFNVSHFQEIIPIADTTANKAMLRFQ